jgi:hypothetical protein
VDLLLNQPTKLKLLKDKPYEGKSEYGAYLLFSVEHEGVEKAYFATAEVAQDIQELGLKSGDEFILTKTAVQNGKKATAQIFVEPVAKPKAVSVVSASDNFRQIMEQSLREAIDITRSVQSVPFQNEDIQKIASCLFIART